MPAPNPALPRTYGSPSDAALSALLSVTYSSAGTPRGTFLAYGLPTDFFTNALSSLAPTYAGITTPGVFGPAGSGSMPSRWSSSRRA